MVIKVLGVGGSPRWGGNSDALLDAALRGAKKEGAEVEKIILNELSIKPCQECGGCNETGVCIIDDDMLLIYDKLAQAHGLIVASPIFFSGISAQLKAMIDRIQCHWVGKYRLVKEITTLPEPRMGVFISVRGQQGHAIFKAAAKPVKAFMATEGFRYLDELFCDAMDYRGAVNDQPQTLTKAYELGKKLVRKIFMYPHELLDLDINQHVVAATEQEEADPRNIGEIDYVESIRSFFLNTVLPTIKANAQCRSLLMGDGYEVLKTIIQNQCESPTTDKIRLELKTKKEEIINFINYLKEKEPFKSFFNERTQTYTMSKVLEMIPIEKLSPVELKQLNNLKPVAKDIDERIIIQLVNQITKWYRSEFPNIMRFIKPVIQIQNGEKIKKTNLLESAAYRDFLNKTIKNSHSLKSFVDLLDIMHTISNIGSHELKHEWDWEKETITFKDRQNTITQKTTFYTKSYRKCNYFREVSLQALLKAFCEGDQPKKANSLFKLYEKYYEDQTERIVRWYE